MRSPRHRSSNRRSESSSKREKSPRGRKRNYDSASPSPPRPSKNELKNIRITIGDISNNSKKSKKFTLLSPRTVEPNYKGVDDELPRSKDQKKIQIEIKRNIPRDKISDSTVRRSIRDPQTVILARKKDEGRKKIFHRDEIKKFNANRPEEKTNAEFGANYKNGNSNSHKESKLNNIRNDQQQNHKQQHTGRSGSPQDKFHSGRNNSHSAPPVQDRLGQQGVDRPLDRQELESRRPQVQSWEVNPEMVPRNRYYFEHDNREDFQQNRGFRGGPGGRFEVGHRGQGRGGGFNSRGGSYWGGMKRQRRDASPDCWQHDKFQEVAEDNNGNE